MLAAEMHDAAAYFVFGEETITNYGLNAARACLGRFLAARAGRKARFDRLRRLQAEYQGQILANTARGVGPGCIRARRAAAATFAVDGRWPTNEMTWGTLGVESPTRNKENEPSTTSRFAALLVLLAARL